MKVFIAGGTGAIGMPLIRALVAAGHQVTASTRSSANVPMLTVLALHRRLSMRSMPRR